MRPRIRSCYDFPCAWTRQCRGEVDSHRLVCSELSGNSSEAANSRRARFQHWGRKPENGPEFRVMKEVDINGGRGGRGACNVRADVLRNRRERLALWRVASGKAGLVNQALAAWLLDVSKQRVAGLLVSGRLVYRMVNQTPLICVASVERYARERKRPGRPRIKGLRAITTS